MSWLSKGLKAVEKNVTRPIGKAAKKAAPVALPILGTMIPGVGNVAGAAIGGALAGATKHGGNVLANAAGGAAQGGAIGGLVNAGKGLVSSMAGHPAAAAPPGTTPGASPSASSGVMSTLGKIFGGPLGPSIIQAAGSTIAGIGQGHQQSQDRDEARREFDLQYAPTAAKLAQYNANAPMRQQLMQLMAQRLGISLPGGAQAPTQSQLPPGMPLGPGSQGLPPQGAPQGAPQMQAPGQPSPEQIALIQQRLRSLF